MKKILLMAAAVVTLFASCSKDATEDQAIVKSDAAFVASMSFDSAATTRHHINNAGKYEWEAGDMVGVSNGETTIPFVTKLGGVTAAFEAATDDLAYLGEGTYYMAYPYGNDLSVTTGTDEITVTGMTIPTTQRYRANSFATMTAPAFAVVEDFENGQEVKFNAPASMFSFPIVGTGAIKKLTLTSTSYNIAGAISAVITEDEDGETEISYTTTGTEKEIVVDFGAGAYNLDYYDAPTKVVFVVASGEIVADEEFTLTATWADSTTDEETFTIPATAEEPVVLEPNTLYEMQPRTFGLDDHYVIAKDNNDAAVRDFILYAYATQDETRHYGTEAAADLHPTVTDLVPFVKEMWGIDATTPAGLLEAKEKLAKQKLLIACDKIDFENFDAEAMYTKYGSSEYKDDVMAGFYRDALYWYIQNGNAIESLEIGEDTMYPGEQAVVGGLDKPTVINGLTVLGNGFTAGANLENLKFTNTTVIATQDDVAGFVAPMGNTANVEDVVLGENNQLIATGAGNNYVGGIVGSLQTHNSKLENITVEALPTIVTTLSLDETSIGQLYGYFGVKSNVVVDLEAYKVSSLDAPAFYMVETASANPSVLEINNIPAGATYSSVFATNHSVRPAAIVADGTSYWSGVVYASAGGDDYFTAEELAYLMTSDAANTVAMTHNIDMQDVKTAVNTSNTRRINIDNEDVFEISNINIEVDGVTGWVSLLGRYAAVENLTVSNLSINVVESNLLTGVAGLATAGTAKDVTMNGVEINIDKESTFNSNPAYVANNFGGVFTEVDTDDIDNVDVKALVINYAGENNLGARAGIIAGTLNVTTNSKGVTLKPFAISGAKGAYAFTNVAKAQPALVNETSGIEGYKKTNNYGTTYAFGTVSVNNAAFAATHQEAILNVANVDFCPWATAFAAGIVFADDLTSDAAGKVNYDAAQVADYDYAFLTNAPIRASGDKGYKVWGFNKE